MSRARGWLACVLVLIALWAAPARALARGGGDPDDPRIERIELPFGSPMAAERWSPVVVHISSGSRAVQGWVEISYAPDGSEDVRIVAPAATTPGTSVPIELAAAPPRNADRLRVRFVSDRGRTLALRELSTQRPAPDFFEKPIEEVVRVIEVGNGTLRDNLQRVPEQTPEGLETGGDAGAPVPDLEDAIRVDPVGGAGGLPHAWLSFQGADVVVGLASELARADARAKSALLQWVGAGGRLVVVVDAPGSEWRTWVPGWEGLIQVGETEVITPGDAAMRATLDRRRQHYPKSAGTGFTGTPQPEPQPLPLGPDTRPLPNATRLPGRVISVSTLGQEKGWVAAWGVTEHAEPSQGLLARGPVGLGVVTLIGVDVAKLRVTDPGRGVRNVWMNLLADDRLSPLPSYKRLWGRLRGGYGFVGWNSGVDATERTAIREALDQVTPNPQIGSAVFYGIAGCLLLLGVGLGPLERFVSRRRRTARWHVSRAMAWIGAMSVAGLLLPLLLRQGESVRGCCDVVDVLGDSQWRCGVVSSYSARPQAVELPREASSVWRGVSAGFVNWEQTRRVGFADLLGSMVLADGGEEAGSIVLAPASQAQWTVRTFQFQMASHAREDALPRVRVTRSATAWKVSIADIPGGVTLGPVQLATRTGRVYPSGPGLEPGGSAMTVEAPMPEGVMWDGRWQPLDRSTDEWYGGGGSRNLQVPALALSGARERDDAIAARVMGGNVACVMLELRGMPDGISTPGKGVRLVRLLVPIEEENAP